MGRQLAAALGYPFLDTGVMYRAITLAAIRRGIDLSDAAALSALAESSRIDVSLSESGSVNSSTVTVDGEDVTSDLRSPAVEDAVSLVSRVPGVRAALVRQQREIASRRPVVMAGRDIGTVVLPDADLKVYLDASIEERARRRYREFASVHKSVSEDDVVADIRRRDQIDSEREVSPLKPAEDAVIIDTDGMSQDEVLARILSLVDQYEA